MTIHFGRFWTVVDDGWFAVIVMRDAKMCFNFNLFSIVSFRSHSFRFEFGFVGCSLFIFNLSLFPSFPFSFFSFVDFLDFSRISHFLIPLSARGSRFEFRFFRFLT